MPPIRKRVHRFQDAVGNRSRLQLVIFRDEISQPVMTIKFHRRRVLRIPDPIRVEDQNVTRVQNVAFLIVHSVFKHPQREPLEWNSLTPPAVIKERLLLPGIRDAQFMTSAMPRRETERHKTPLDPSFTQKSVNGAKHFRRRMLLRTYAA